MSKNIFFVITHPIGNATHNFRLNSFIETLKNKSYSPFLFNIIYPFKSSYQGISKGSSIICKEVLINIHPRVNIIQKIVSLCQFSALPYIVTKVLYAFHIVLYKIDLWYVPLHKQLEEDTSLGIERSIIVGSGGPGSVIKMAYKISKSYNCKLIIDYRDPWNLGYDLLGTGKWINIMKRRLMLQTEISIIEKANHITVVAESFKAFFPEKYHYKISVIENGSNFEQEEIIEKISPKPEVFNIVYVGTIYNDQLIDLTFFEAFCSFYKSIGYSNKVSLKFIGSNKNGLLKRILKKYNLENITFISDRLSSEDLLPYLLNASLFLHLRFDGRSQIITSKNADYLMFRKPILLPLSDNGDIEKSIKKYKAGYVCNGIEQTVEALNKEFKKFQNGENIILDQPDLSFISRSNLALKFLKIIEETA